MADISILEKPEWITYDDIHNLLWKANELNRETGFILKTSEMSGEELEKRIGSDGKCFVALDDQTLVGTLSVRVIERNAWYYNGKALDYILAGTHPEYQGKHINTMLSEKAFKYAEDKKYELIELDTAIDNQHAIKIYKHLGFIPVDFLAKKNLDHYSIVMAKPLGEFYINRYKASLLYQLKRIAIICRYKKGKRKRFGL